MTIATRNHFIVLATIITALLCLIAIGAAVFIFVFHAIPAGIGSNRTLSFLNDFFLTSYSLPASIIALMFLLLYIIVAFEKTQTMEITFFAVCMFALAFESMRMIIPLCSLWTSFSVSSAVISRIVIFSRFLFLFALLASGIVTASEKNQQIGVIIFLLAFFSFCISNIIPMNSGSVTSCFIIEPGYGDTIHLFFVIFGIMSIISYLIPGIRREIPEYKEAAGGLCLLLAGYSVLTMCDSWLFLIGGVILFCCGVWIYLDRLHQYYLWQ